MTTRRRTSYPHIVRVPGVVGGEPTIKGTRIPVRAVAIKSHMGESIESICQADPGASRTAIDEALRFYADHRAEIDQYIEVNEREAQACDALEDDNERAKAL